MFYRPGTVALLCFALACGCGKATKDKPQDDSNMLYGQVTLDGEHVAGVMVIAQTSDGTQHQGGVDQDGTYRIPDPPQGAVTIFLQPILMPGSDIAAAKMMLEAKRLDKQAATMPTVPAEAVKPPTIEIPENMRKGMEVGARIPERYRNPKTSPLRTVISGEKTKYDLTLTTNPP